MIIAERLRELLHYEPETGKFTRLVSTSSNARAGDVAGYPTRQGYLQIGADGKYYFAHRLAFLYMTGEWPRNQIDHINLDKSDNRWSNLREATNAQNQANKATLFGFKGAIWHKTNRKWCAKISRNNKTRHLGYLATQQEAAVAYAEAAKEFQGEFARPFNSRVTTPIMNNHFHSSLASGSLSCLRDDAAGARSLSLDGGADAVLAVAPIAIHESSHCIVARFLGLPVAGVTIKASADYAGLCFGPDTEPSKVTPTVLREEAERRCNDATELLPLPGERRDCTASWVVHAQSLVMESVAGWAGEELAGFNRELEAGSTDYIVARMYARSVVMSDEAVPSFVAACRADATQILKTHWSAVEAVAAALDERKMLTGADIDTIIIEAEQRAVHVAELQRRARMTAMTARAKSGAESTGASSMRSRIE